MSRKCGCVLRLCTVLNTCIIGIPWKEAALFSFLFWYGRCLVYLSGNKTEVWVLGIADVRMDFPGRNRRSCKNTNGLVRMHLENSSKIR